jgi:ABC-type nitrate/sulfonate/bicarbonate transport system substrate-binding protein
MKKKIILATGHAHAFHRASVLAAVANGYFLDEGLPEVEVRATGEDDLTIEALKEGTIDFGLDPRPHSLLAENAKGAKVYIVAGMLNHLDLTLVSIPEVKSIADLKGRKVGFIEQGHGRDATWVRILLRKAGMDPDKDITPVLDVGYGSLEFQKPRMERGDYVAKGLSGHYNRPELYEQVRQAGFNVLAERSETHPDGLPDRVVATTGDMIEHHPEIVAGVLKGVIRGYRFARDPRNAPQLREMYLAQDWGKDGFGWGRFDNKLLDGMVSSARVLPPDGSISLTGLEDVMAGLRAEGKLPGDFNREQILRLGPLQEAVRDLNARYGTEGYA